MLIEVLQENGVVVEDEFGCVVGGDLFWVVCVIIGVFL